AKIQAAYTSNNHVGLAFSGYNTGLSEMMRIIDGNVGIGTTGPGAKLHIEDSVNTSPLTGLASSYASSLKIRSNYFAEGTIGAGFIEHSAGGGMQIGVTRDHAGGIISFWTNNSGMGERLRITNTGNIGIGTTGPVGKLHIQAAGTDRFILGNNTAGDVNTDSPKLSFWGGGANPATTIIGPSMQKVYKTNYGRGDLVFWQHGGADYTSETEAMVIQYTGNVGIGTTSPSYKLDVAGDLRITGTPYRTGGDIAWQTPSDSRLKNIVGVVDRGITDLMKLNEVKFNYKADNPFGLIPNQTHIGLIAQDVQKIFPEAVMEDRGYLTLNTTPIFWAMLKGAQEQQTQISGITENQNKIVNQLTGQLADQSLSVDNKLQLIGASLDALTTEQIETLKDQIIAQTSDIDALQAQMADIETNMYIERYDELWSFYQNFELAKVPLKNALENVFEGKITAQDIEALNTIKAKDIEATDSVTAESIKGQNLELGAQVSGTGMIEAGKTEVVVSSPYVSGTAKISLTPKGSTQGKNIFVDDITEGVSFKVKIDAPAVEKDVNFYWFIIK
ncbi:MAG: tail fiber domain-containing protein, partial [Candidatus Moraniibacteriota bacterium]